MGNGSRGGAVIYIPRRRVCTNFWLSFAPLERREERVCTNIRLCVAPSDEGLAWRRSRRQAWGRDKSVLGSFSSLPPSRQQVAVTPPTAPSPLSLRDISPHCGAPPSSEGRKACADFWNSSNFPIAHPASSIESLKSNSPHEWARPLQMRRNCLLRSTSAARAFHTLPTRCAG